ncbi:hypothetical protein NDU88_001411 [Pleurodeles waltl]|uniref:Uncharacterized protein n=1 Tax=Pleurodeles waltl TaxID=8319 RepID=A0AAV7Q6T2_PLEWA|nr:hypothetical protein NDU88_001411 [Pleurodeles waltl]
MQRQEIEETQTPCRSQSRSYKRRQLLRRRYVHSMIQNRTWTQFFECKTLTQPKKTTFFQATATGLPPLLGHGRQQKTHSETPPLTLALKSKTKHTISVPS